jgi:hypothetical protein
LFLVITPITLFLNKKRHKKIIFKSFFWPFNDEKKEKLVKKKEVYKNKLLFECNKNLLNLPSIIIAKPLVIIEKSKADLAKNVKYEKKLDNDKDDQYSSSQLSRRNN